MDGKVYRRGNVYYYQDRNGKRRSLQTRDRRQAIAKAASIEGAPPPAPPRDDVLPQTVIPDDALGIPPDPLLEIGAEAEEERDDADDDSAGPGDDMGDDHAGALAATTLSPGQEQIAAQMATLIASVGLALTAAACRYAGREPGAVAEATFNNLVGAWSLKTREWVQDSSMGPWTLILAATVGAGLEQVTGGQKIEVQPDPIGGLGVS